VLQVTFYGVCTSTAGDLQLVFELCAKGSMRSLLQSSAELPWDQRLQVATDIASAMKYIPARPGTSSTDTSNRTTS